MTPFVPTSAEALRAAIASSIACSPQELEQAIGQIVVAVATDLPAIAELSPKTRSVRDLQARSTVLLADRIPEGEEAKAAVTEVKLWHGLAVAQAVFGQAADKLLTPASPRRFSISSSSGSGGRRYWQRDAWAARTPDWLYTVEEADAEVERLKRALPHDKTIQRVDEEQLAAMGMVWNRTFNPALTKSGYGAIPMDERQSESARALRAAAIELADQAVREAGFADFKGWTEWSSRLPEPKPKVDAELLKNVVGNVAVPPFYIWANDDCDSKAQSFEEAKRIRLELFNDGGASVHIVGADGVEVVDAEIEAHEALAVLGYFAGARQPDVKLGFPGAFMVNDPLDPDGYAIVGDDIASLIKEARDHLVTPTQLTLPEVGAIEALAQRCLADGEAAAERRFATLVGMSPERFISEIEGGHARDQEERLALRFSDPVGQAGLNKLIRWVASVGGPEARSGSKNPLAVVNQPQLDLEWSTIADEPAVGISAKGFFVTNPLYDEGQIDPVDPSEYWGISERQAKLIVDLNEELPEAVDDAINAVCRRLQAAAGIGDTAEMAINDAALRNKLMEAFAEYIVAEVNGSRNTVSNDPVKQVDDSPSPGM